MSEKYVVLYIDESEEQRTLFDSAFEDTEQFEVVPLIPEPALEEMIEKIIEYRPSAVVCDFNLKEYAPSVGYFGGELVDRLKELKPKLPCFLFTSYEEDAITKTLDVNRVHAKKELYNSDGVAFYKKVVQQVNVNETLYQQQRSEYLELLDKSKTSSLLGAEDRRLVELEHELEEYQFSESKIPSDVMEGRGLDRLDQLLDLSERLMEKLDATS